MIKWKLLLFTLSLATIKTTSFSWVAINWVIIEPKKGSLSQEVPVTGLILPYELMVITYNYDDF